MNHFGRDGCAAWAQPFKRPIVVHNERLSRGEVDAVSALSGETLDNFLAMIGPEGERLAAATPLLVPHEAVARHRGAKRFARAIVTGHGTPALIDDAATLKTAA